MSDTYYRRGCIVATTQRERGRGWIEWLMSLVSWLIAVLSRMPKEARTRSTHSAIVVRSGTLETAMILEALWPRVQVAPLSKYAGAMTVYRPRGISVDVLKRMATMAMRHAHLTGGRRRGMIYGLLKLPLFALDLLLSKALCYCWLLICALVPGLTYRPFERRVFTRFNLIWIFVCSQVVARVYGEIAGIIFCFHWSRVTPDDIDDYCMAHPEQFERVYG